MKNNVWRLFWVQIGILTVVLVFFARLFYLQVLQYDFFTQKSHGQLKKIIKIQAHRGSIYDRDGIPIAVSQPAVSVYAVPKTIKNKRAFSKKIAPFLNMSSWEIYKKVNVSLPFVWLKRRITKADADRLRQAKIKGINFIKEEKRFYPGGDFSADVLGFVGTDGGLAGLEYQHNKFLTGSLATLVIEGDPLGRALITSKHNLKGAPKGFRHGAGRLDGVSFDGGHIHTTIDSFIQYTAQKHLAKGVIDMEAERGQVIVMDPNTGEILAMADYPGFDPNKFYDYPYDVLKNSCIVDIFEPGSIFKIVTLSSVIEEQLVKPDSVIQVPETMELGSRMIKESHPRDEDDDRGDDRTVTDILSESLNVGTTLLALEIGEPKFYKYMRSFGFGSRYNVSLPGESQGLLRPVKDWKEVDIGMMSFGQGIGVTSLQMVTAASAVVNGGKLPQPRVISYFSDHDGVSVRATPKRFIRRVISKDTSQKMVRMIETVVTDGTGRIVRIPGYRIGGKTGTAQIAGPDGSGYLRGKYACSFLGVFPLSKPRFVVLVTIYSPQKYKSGSMVAGPVFKRITQDIIDHYSIIPDAH